MGSTRLGGTLEIKIIRFGKGWGVMVGDKNIHASDKPSAILKTIRDLLVDEKSETPEIPKKQPPLAPKIVKV